MSTCAGASHVKRATPPPHLHLLPPIYAHVSVSNKGRGDRKSNLALMSTICRPPPPARFVYTVCCPTPWLYLHIGIFWDTVLIRGWWEEGVYRGHIDVQHILKPTQLKNNNNSRKCPRLSVTLQLTGSLTYQLWSIPLAIQAIVNIS